MNRVGVQSRLRYEVREPTSFSFCVAAASTNHQIIESENLRFIPHQDATPSRVGLAENRIIRIHAEPGIVELFYRANVALDPRVDSPQILDERPVPRLPSSVLPYLYPSRYCPSDRLGAWAEGEFGQCAPGYARVEAICDWIFERIEYRLGSTNAHDDAGDVLLQRAGVCRDFAHLAISFCRALCIPARYVSGYAAELEPPDFHGFFEAYLGGEWYLFDATRLAPPSGLVRIGTGRDAADCSFANIVGRATLSELSVEARFLDDLGSEDDATSTAISTA